VQCVFVLSITLRDTKSNKDRVTLLPEAVVPALKLHLAKVKAQHQEDLANGYGEVELPYALAGKYPRAAYEWGWQYVFPAAGFSTDPRSGHVRRHHIFETSLQKAVCQAARKARIEKPVHPHILRHCFATHLARRGVDIRTIQELRHTPLKLTVSQIKGVLCLAQKNHAQVAKRSKSGTEMPMIFARIAKEIKSVSHILKKHLQK
jgi:integrase